MSAGVCAGMEQRGWNGDCKATCQVDFTILHRKQFVTDMKHRRELDFVC